MPAFGQKKGGKKPARPARVTVDRSTYDVPGDIQSGESTVIVRTSNVIHRVAIAPNGIVAVEFPADDAVVSDHAGNTDLVTLDGKEDGGQGRRPTDPLIFRPGSAFPSEPVKGVARKALTMYSVQMASGLFVSFLFYPVADLSQNTNRVILQYKILEIQEARQSAGLRTNMIANVKPKVVKEAERIVAAERAEKAAAASGQPVPVKETPKPTSAGDQVAKQPEAVKPAAVPTPQAVVSKPVETPKPTPAVEQAAKQPEPVKPVATPEPVVPKPASQPKTEPTSDTSRGVKVSVRDPEALPVPVKFRAPENREFIPVVFPSPIGVASVEPVVTTTPDAPPPPVTTPTVDVPKAPAPKKNDRPAEELWMRATRLGNEAKIGKLPPFGKSVYGLSLGIVRVEEYSAKARIVVVAVRNTLTVPIRITPGQPELFVETIDNGLTVQSERLKPIYIWSSLDVDALFEPGTVQFYAIAFEPPILGIQQTLRIGISQTNAADAPAGATLTEKGR
jgi:hypothetical protein